MKLKKGILLTVLTLAIVTIMGIFSSVQAAIATKRTLTLRETGYTVDEKKVYRIVDKANDRNETFYCIKGGPGFGSTEWTINPTEYTNATGVGGVVGDLRNPDNINTTYKNALPQNADNYKGLMYVLDKCYVPAKNNVDGEVDRAAKDKKALIDAVSAYIGETILPTDITDADIFMVQQLAIWHFTNVADDGYGFDSLPNFSLNGKLLDPTHNDDDEIKWNACSALFDYLIDVPADYDYTKNTNGTALTYWSEEIVDGTSQPVVQIEKVKQPEFDLALRKFITSINDIPLTGDDSREPKISDETLAKLANGETLTLEKVHPKNALTVANGYKVLYTIRIYNEGELDGWATQVTDYLPAGLTMVPVANSTTNAKYGWTASTDGRTITTSYLANEARKLEAFEEGGTTVTTGEVKKYKGLSYIDLQIECEVTANATGDDIDLKNIAEITGHKDINGNVANTKGIDRDSEPSNVNTNTSTYAPKAPTKGTGEQDDDDFELLVLPGKVFDLSLRKFIIGVVTSKGKTVNVANRAPQVDVNPLLTGKTTANYYHTKDAVGVSNGDIVTYTIRVYNEGKVDGYVTEITDHLPKQLEFIVDDELNAKYGWTVSSNGRTVKTDITSPTTKKTANRNTIYAQRNSTAANNEEKVLLKAFGYTQNSTLDYIDVQIRCRVKENIDLYEKITNIAEITKFTDATGATIKDRDSEAAKGLTLPTDIRLPEYTGGENKKNDPHYDGSNVVKGTNGKVYYPGQEDDDDYEKLVLQRFDLALRKFITGVISGDKTTNVTDRAPVFKKVNNIYTYDHTKEPVDVANGNIVIYTLRIFNEGNVDGYATEIRDDLPDGLEFLPEHSTNTAFGWKMYKEDGTETKDLKEASYIKTDFLSKAKEVKEYDNLIKAFNPQTMTMPNYKDIKIAFKVTEPNTSDRIIINEAQIAEDSDKNGNPIDDIDSVPNEWNDGEDDQDIEKIKVKFFDLSLKKWVTESIVTVDGKTTVTKSGHTGNENPEPPMKVEIQNGKINKTTVKFRFNIKVTNEGEIAGYAKELIDYIPAGLKFNAKDNPKWKQVDGKVVTDQLKDKLLKPGESATVDIVLTWINGKDNMGQKVNWAEINKDDNEFDSPDIDSTPGNNVKGEDDIDQAPVLLSPATGSSPTYVVLALGCVTIIASGVVLIKKFVI